MKEEKKDFTDLGDKVLERIGDCLDQMDYSQLGDTIRESVDFIRQEAEKGYREYRVKNSKEFERFSHNMETPYERHLKGQEKDGRALGGLHQAKTKKNPPGLKEIIANLPGKVSGPVSIGFGIAMIAIFGFASLVLGPLISAGGMLGGMGIAGSVISIPATAAGIALLVSGLLSKGRYDRIQGYAKYLLGKEFVEVDDLVAKTSGNKKQVLKDIRFLLKSGLIPSMSMDEKESYIFFSDRARQGYLDMETSRIEREIEEVRRREEAEEIERKKASASKEERQFLEFEEAILTFLNNMEHVEKEISSPVMIDHSNKIHELLTQILACIKGHPDMIYGTGHLVSYYLPCMEKLFKTYSDLEKQPIQGENIQKTKKEIETSFETIETALSNMYDELFQEVSMDISSDIQVLKTVMAQDGIDDGVNGNKMQ